MMALAGSDFVVELAPRGFRCSQCGLYFSKGHTVLVARRDGFGRKRVCSEECRLDFDDAFWQDRADRREAGST